MTLTDSEWRVIEPLLPNKPRGVPRVDDRRVLNGIFWVLRSGARWRDLPERYGLRTTCYNRFVRWRKAGVWDRLMDAITKAHDSRLQMIDTSIVRVHQQGATAKKGYRDHCLGRSRGGLTTKIHALVDAQGRPIKLTLTAGQVSDIASAADLIKDLPEGAMLLADKGYDANAFAMPSTSERHGITSRPRPTARPRSASARSSTRRGTWSSASSTKPISSAASRPDTTSWPRTISPLSNSSQSASGYAVMSLRPSIVLPICFP
jgi:transposase